MKKTALLGVLGLALVSGSAWAADEPAAVEKAPVNQPAVSDIPSLITQLGADSPKAREQASLALRKIGKDALPALAKAKESDDPEVSTRAEAISKQIDEDLHPKPQPQVSPFGGNMVGPGVIRLNGVAGGGVMVGGAGGGMISVRMVANGADSSKSITVKENGKSINIDENKEGIKMTVTQPDKEGKDETKEYKAKDAETLKKESPEAYELYEKYTKGNKNNGVQIQINNGVMNLQQLQGVNGINPKELQEMQKVMEQNLKQVKEAIEQIQIEVGEAKVEEKK